MVIYADVLIIVNLYVDFFLLWAVKKFLHLPRKSFRLVLGSFVGAICSLYSLLPELSSWLSLLAGLLSALLTAACAFLPLSSRLFLKAALALWMFSLLLAGFFLFLFRFLPAGRGTVMGNVLYLDLSLPALFFGTLFAYGVFRLFHRMFPREGTHISVSRLLVENRGIQREIFAKADTGNALREPFSGLPVIVVQKESLVDLAPPGLLDFITPDGNTKPSLSVLEGFRLVPFQSVGGEGVLPAFRPHKVQDKKTGKSLSCYVALCSQKLSAGQFDAIYNPGLFGTAE